VTHLVNEFGLTFSVPKEETDPIDTIIKIEIK